MLSHERFENVDKTNDLACIKKNVTAKNTLK